MKSIESSRAIHIINYYHSFETIKWNVYLVKMLEIIILVQGINESFCISIYINIKHFTC
jgi:hypothetical protein